MKNTMSANANTLISTKRDILGFDMLQFTHKATAGDTGIDLFDLNPASGFINPSADRIMSALNAGATLVASNGQGASLAQGGTELEYQRVGSRIVFNGFTAGADEIFHFYLWNVPQQGRVDLVDGGPFEVVTQLQVSQTIVPLGQSIKVPLTGEPEPIIVKRTGGEPQPRGDAWDYVNPENGFTNAIELVNAGQDLGGGELETIQVHANGIMPEGDPNGVRQVIQNFEGRINAIAEILETNFGIDPTTIQIVSPSFTDQKTFGNKVVELDQRLTTVENSLNVNTQIKILSSNRSTTILDEPELRFNNLEIGRFYLVSGQCFSDAPGATANASMEVYDSTGFTSTIIKFGASGAAGVAPGRAFYGSSGVFQATTSEMVTVISAGSGGIIFGNGSRDQTWVQLTELPGFTTTTTKWS